MEVFSVYDAHGCNVTRLYNEAMDCEVVDVTVPDDSKFLTFDIGPWLVLDPYGDDSMAKTIRQRIFGNEHLQALAIHRETGQLGYAAYFQDPDDGGAHAIVVIPWMPDGHPNPVEYKLPTFFLPFLDELRNQKRPYTSWVSGHALQDVLDGEEGYSYLRSEVEFAFRFKNGTIETDGHRFREVSDWEFVDGDPTPVEDDEDSKPRRTGTTWTAMSGPPTPWSR